MKKIFSVLLGGGFVGLSLCSMVFAAGTEVTLNEKNITTLFVGSQPFGYDSSHKVTVKSMSNDSIVLKSPILEDELDDVINDYVVLYGVYSFSDLSSNPSLLTGFSEMSFSSDDSADEIEMTVDDNLDKDKIYYAIVVPSDQYGLLGNFSNEICFRLRDQIYGEGQDCLNGSADSFSDETNSHTARSWEQAINLANASCTRDGKTVTFNWSPTDIGKVNISLYNEKTNKFDIKTTINASQQRTVSIDVVQDTAPIVRWDDTEGLSAYKTYTCHTLATETKTSTNTGSSKSTKVTTVPTVGPKENVLAILIGAVVLYLVYTIVRRKAD